MSIKTPMITPSGTITNTGTSFAVSSPSGSGAAVLAAISNGELGESSEVEMRLTAVLLIAVANSVNNGFGMIAVGNSVDDGFSMVAVPSLCSKQRQALEMDKGEKGVMKLGRGIGGEEVGLAEKLGSERKLGQKVLAELAKRRRARYALSWLQAVCAKASVSTL